MKVEIPITKDTTYINDIKTPAFYVTPGKVYTAVMEKCIIVTCITLNYTYMVHVSEKDRFGAELLTVLKHGTECTKEEFDQVYNENFKCMAGHYQPFDYMNEQQKNDQLQDAVKSNETANQPDLAANVEQKTEETAQAVENKELEAAEDAVKDEETVAQEA